MPGATPPFSLTFSPDSALSSSACSNFPIGNLFALVSGLASLFSSRFPVHVCENCRFSNVKYETSLFSQGVNWTSLGEVSANAPVNETRSIICHAHVKVRLSHMYTRAAKMSDLEYVYVRSVYIYLHCTMRYQLSGGRMIINYYLLNTPQAAVALWGKILRTYVTRNGVTLTCVLRSTLPLD